MSFGRFLARTTDTMMCLTMFAIQRRHHLRASSREELERYIALHAQESRDTHFITPPISESFSPEDSVIRWISPIASGFPENNIVQVNLYRCAKGWSAPTVLFLHALMSASDIGYRSWAATFNERGWNACFVHLPYHYSRKPKGHFNGELAITADLVRTAEGLRQGVSELRQLLALLREWGCNEFGLWASSYGGWIGALLASVERDFRFVSLMEPIVDVEYAIWVSPAGRALRRELVRHQIDQQLIERHFHLASPRHAEPLCGSDRVLFCAGDYDLIALAEDIEALHRSWKGSELIRVPQGHFGYQMMRNMWTRLQSRGLV